MSAEEVVFGIWTAGCIAGLSMMSDTVRRLIFGSFGRAQPIVKLACDMLDVPTGWVVSYHHYRHQTGLEIDLWYDGFVRSLEIDGSPVVLSAADKLRLQRAIKRLDRHCKAVADDQAAQLLAQRARAFAQRAEQFADIIVTMRNPGDAA